MTSAVPLKQLGDLCDVIGGGTPPKDKPAFYTGDILWATVRDMNLDVIDDTAFKITKEAVKASATNIIPPNNVVIASRVGLGKVCLTRYPTAINQDLRGIIPHNLNALSVDYLFWWFKSIAHLIEKEGKGATVKGVTLPFIKSLKIPVPPVEEQKRIVAILDQAFDAIDTADANTEKNRLNAAELFESKLDAALTLPTSQIFIETRLGNEVELQVGFAFKSSEFTEEPNDIRLLRGDNIVPGRFRWDGVKRYPAKGAKEYRQFALAQDDIVLAMDRPWVSAGLKRAQICPDDLPCLLVQRTARMRGKSGLDNRFLYHLTGSRQFISHLIGNQTGLGVPHISAQQIKDFQFQKPALPEQRRIAARLDSLWHEVGNITANVSRKSSAIAELRGSILNAAFAGQL